MANAQRKKQTITNTKATKSPRRDRLEARVRKTQKSLFQRAADLQGKSLTDFLIHSAQQEAIKTIREYESIILGAEDQRILMEALRNPAPPNKALKSAAKMYLKNRR